MASKASSTAKWLKGVTNNTKPSTSYKYNPPSTEASRKADAARRAAADAQINSTKPSTYSGSATLYGKQKVMSDAGKAAYAKTGDTRAGSAAASLAGQKYDAAARAAAADAQVNSTKPSTHSGSASNPTKPSSTSGSSSGSSSSNSFTNIINYGGSGGSGGSAGGSASGSSEAAAQLILGLPVEAQRAALADGQSLAELYGIDYNRDNIEQIFQDATDAEHKANLAEYNRTMRQYYDKLGSTQNSLIDTLRQQRAASIRNGANAGMQNATELSEILGLTQAVSPDALALAQDRNALIEAYNAQRAQNVRDALEYSDQLKQALAALASEKYGYDAQQYVGELSHNANVQAQNTASSAAYTGNKYATLEDILGLAVVPSLTYTNEAVTEPAPNTNAQAQETTTSTADTGSKPASLKDLLGRTTTPSLTNIKQALDALASKNSGSAAKPSITELVNKLLQQIPVTHTNKE